MTPRVLLASCAGLPSAHRDDAPLVDALAALGITADWARWDDPDTDFGAAELVVLRSTWDYPERRAEFLAWCDAVPGLRNPAAAVRWNTSKHYLPELAARGVDVVPTQVLEPGDPPEWPVGEFALKPAVGASSRGAARFGPGRLAEAAAHLAELRRDGGAVVVQPYQEAVDREGEVALVFLGGVYSHAFAKGPALAAAEPAEFRGGARHEVPAPGPWRALAESALDAAAGMLGLPRRALLYARVDLVRSARGAPLLLELELTEPFLGLRLAPGAPERFASAVRAELAAAVDRDFAVV
ncbi:hypothetical protein [Saccharopolyspora cebuensis]|uniref:ATP-grasp domain-containing protein n=1 Tax=Saccharopolyspora cebuensis TaxID=418759 RepID=A0ABV4CEX5_9PSEU